jgi:hypothetical protein
MAEARPMRNARYVVPGEALQRTSACSNPGAITVAAVLAVAAGSGCHPIADAQAKQKNTQAYVMLGVNAKIAEGQAWGEAIKYERWDEAVTLTEKACAAADVANPSDGSRATARRSCLRRRVQAYEGRALARANEGKFHDAILDEEHAGEAADDMSVANSEYEQYERSTNLPSVVIDMHVKQAADEGAKLRAISKYRLLCYQRGGIPNDAYANQGIPRPDGQPPTMGAVSVTAPSPPSAGSPGPASDFVVASPQPASYAVVVGIETYRDVPAAKGAHGDAVHFAALLKQTLGLSDSNIRIALDDRATRSDIVGALTWLRSNVSAGGRVYFFYSGHGAPSTDKSTYLVSYDADPKNLPGSSVAMSDVLAALAATKAKEVVAIVDACFSGAGGRSILPPGARPLMRVRDEQPTASVALFTASGGDEISGLAPGEGNGLFTKWVTTGLGSGQADADGDGQITMQELSDWVGPRVARDAKKDGREQHPTLTVGSGIGAAKNLVVEYGLKPH